MDTLVQVSNVTKTYDNDGAPAVAHVSMDVSPGESVAVMGPFRQREINPAQPDRRA